MKRVGTLILAVAMLLASVGMFAGCGKKDDKGAIFNIYYVGEVYDFDPAGALVDDGVREVMSMIFEPLFRITSSGKLEGAMAKSWKYIKSENKVEITLNESYWSDGTAVSANHYLYAWERILEPNFLSEAAPLLYEIKNAVAVKNGDTSKYNLGVTADRRLISITLEDGANVDTFLRNLASVALSPIRDDIIEKQNRQEYWTKRTFTLVTNGPFKVTNLIYNDKNEGSFRLERNPYYRRAVESEKALDKYVKPYRMETDWNLVLEEAYTAYIEKTIFYIGDVPLEKRAEASKKAHLHDALSTYTYYFNLNNPLFADENVRLALSAAIDRKEIASILTYASAATGLIAPGVSNGSKLKKSFASANGAKLLSTADMDAARTYLSNATYKGSKQFTLTFRDSEEGNAIAEYVKAQWEQIGFVVKLKPLSSKSITITENDTDISLHEDALQVAYEKADYDVIGIDCQMKTTNAFPLLATFCTAFSGNGTDMEAGSQTGVYETRPHLCGYTDAAYDEIMTRAYAEKDETKRAAILHEAEEYLLNHMVVMPVVFNKTCYLSSKQLKGITVDYFGNTDLRKVNLKNYKKYLPKEEDEAE